MDDIIPIIANFLVLEEYVMLKNSSIYIKKILDNRKIYFSVTLQDIEIYNFGHHSITNIKDTVCSYDKLKLFINLEKLNLCLSNVTMIPPELINLKYLRLLGQRLYEIPNTLVNLETLITMKPKNFDKSNFLKLNKVILYPTKLS